MHDVAVEEEVDEEKLPPDNELLHHRRYTSESRHSTRHPSSNFVLVTDKGEPKSFEEMKALKTKNCWSQAMPKRRSTTYIRIILDRFD